MINSVSRSHMAPYWDLAKYLRKYTNRLLRDWQLPPDTTPLQILLEPPKGEDLRGASLADTVINFERHWRMDKGCLKYEPGNMPGGWHLKIGWRIFLKRLDDYEDRFAVGEECVKHELSHVLHTPFRLLNAITYGGSFSSPDHSDKVLAAWGRTRLGMYEEYSDHGTGWQQMCGRVGCLPTANIDTKMFPLTSSARVKYGIAEPFKGLSLTHTQLLLTLFQN